MRRVSLGKSLREDRDAVNPGYLTVSNKSSSSGLNTIHSITASRLGPSAVRFTPQDLAQAVAERFISIFLIRGKAAQPPPTELAFTSA